MNSEYEQQKSVAVTMLRFCGYFIALMGVVGLLFYYFNVANTRDYPLIVAVGTVFCLIGSLRMFSLARDLRDRRH